MDWIRANKSLAIIVGVAFAGAVGLGIYLGLAYGGYSDSLDSLQSLSGKIANMEKAKLYPNEDNLQAKEEKVSAYEEEVGNLGKVLLSLQKQVTTKPITDTDFQGKLKQRIAEFRDKAAEAKVGLPKEFAFAFDTYTHSLPQAAATQDLNDYLDGVDAIVSATLDSGVKSIDSLGRTDLAVEKGALSPKHQPKKLPPPPKSKKKPRKGAKAEPVVKAPVEITQVVEKRTVTLDITTDQAPLQTLLNTLASASLMTHFTVLRVLRIENEKLEGPLTNGRPKTATGGYDIKNSSGLVDAVAEPVATPAPAEGAAPATAKAEVIEAAKADPPDAQKVLGGEMLKAHIEIDLIRFLEPDSAQ
jgi:hypothetical protein